MDEQYSKSFNLIDNDDVYYHKIISTIGVEVFRKVLDEDIKIINKSSLSMPAWAKFKYNLLNCEKEWQIELFKWTALVNPKYPYIGINIDWDKLENKSSRYFQVHMAFENIWMDDNRLANVWEYIDRAGRHNQTKK